MRMTTKISGLYAVTPDSVDTALLLEQVLAAIEGGAALVQYRNKSANETLRYEQAGALLALCRHHHIPLIINDHLSLCLDIGADGMHLGRTDGDMAATRSQLGTGRLLGVSCYDRLEFAMQATDAGANYVAFGSCFPSATKPTAIRAPLHLFGQAKRLGVPMVAIGGITSENAALVVAAGANAIAVIDGLWAATDVRKVARTYSNLFMQGNNHDYT